MKETKLELLENYMTVILANPRASTDNLRQLNDNFTNNKIKN